VYHRELLPDALKDIHADSSKNERLCANGKLPLAFAIYIYYIATYA